MMSKHETLAEEIGLGQVVLCRNCDDVHVSIGNTAVRLSQGSFFELLAMMQSAADQLLMTHAGRTGLRAREASNG